MMKKREDYINSWYQEDEEPENITISDVLVCLAVVFGITALLIAVGIAL